MFLQHLPLIALAVSPTDAAYRFVEDTTPWVAVERGLEYSIGKLDDQGSFVPDRRYMGLKAGYLSSGLPIFRYMNFRRPGWQTVYEYRSGRLILGELDETGHFVPKIGSKVIPFKDYRYSEKAIRIYNLPGSFVKNQGHGKSDGR